MTGSKSVADDPIVSPDRVRNDFQDILRSAQRRGWTDEKLESLSGIKARTIKGYRLDGKEPCTSAALSICCTLGQWAMNAMLAPAGYQARPIDEADQIGPSQVIADCMKHFTVLAEAAADGRFDHVEMPGVRDASDGIIATVLPYSRLGAGS